MNTKVQSSGAPKSAKGKKEAPAHTPGKRDTDWDAIERDFRTGKFTLRELGAKYSISHAAIGKRSRDKSWVQDLGTAIKQATNARLTKELVSKEVDKGFQEVSNTVLAVAEVNTQVILGHRRQVQDVRGAALNAMAKVNALGDSVADIREAGALASAVESLGRTFKNLADMERKAFGLDDGDTNPGSESTYEKNLDLLKT